MVDIVRQQRSETATAVPATLEDGQLAVNIPDKKIWIGDSSNQPVEIAGATGPIGPQGPDGESVTVFVQDIQPTPNNIGDIWIANINSNLLAAEDATFEGGTVGNWIINGSVTTLDTTTSWASDGSVSGRVLASSTLPSIRIAPAGMVPAVEGEVFSMGLDINVPVDCEINLFFRYYKSNGSSAAGTQTTTFDVTKNSITRLESVNFTAPVDTAFVGAIIRCDNFTTGQSYLVDKIAIRKGDTADWIHPDAPAGKSHYVWDGITWNEIDGTDGSDGPIGPSGADGNDGAIGPEGPSAVSTDTGNLSTIGTDSLIYTGNHSHSTDDIGDLDTTLEGYAEYQHGHLWEEIGNRPVIPDNYGYKNIIINGRLGTVNKPWIINQRLFDGNWAGTGIYAGDYGYDRWTRNTATSIKQYIEFANIIARNPYVLAWQGGGSGEISLGSTVVSGVSPLTLVAGNSSTDMSNYVTVPSTVTNVQLEPGTIPTPFEIRAKGLELTLCQRYAWKPDGYYDAVPRNDNASSRIAVIQFPVTMRVAPYMTGPTVDLGTYNGSTIYKDTIRIFVTSTAASSFTSVHSMLFDAEIEFVIPD